MSGITRQSEQYGVFDNTPAPERTAREAAPESVVREYTRGRSVGAGQLNPRGISHTAGWHTPDFDPRIDAGPEYYEGDPNRPSRSELGDDYRYGPEEFEEEGYQEPPLGEHGDPGFSEDDVGRPNPFGTPIYNPRSSPYDRFTGSRLGFNRLRTADDMAAVGGMGAPLFTHMFMPGHRVGLQYQDRVIPGVVTKLHPDSQVGVRWDDGQHSTESPGDIYRI